jgi:3-oxoacyl-[acyl-carrier-protein] synthase-3
MNAGIRSLAVGFPKTVRDNDWFVKNHPDVYASMESRALAHVFNAKNGDAKPHAFDDAMTPYLRDPFRGTKLRRAMEPGDSQIDLERDVALEALRVAKLAVEDVDMILVSAFPTAHTGVGDGVFLAKALGTRKPAFNVETACSGGLASLQLAAAMVSSGQAKNVLVVVSCIYSKASDWRDTLTWFLGDGVGAYVVGEVPDGEGFQAFHAVNTAESCGSFAYELEDTADGPKAIIRAGAEAGRALRDVTPRAIKDVCGGLARAAGVALEDVDFFVPNTPLAWFADTFAETLGVSREKTVSTYDEYANMGPALNPVNLHRALAQGRIQPGDDVMLFSIGSVSTAAGAIFRAGAIAIGDIVER